MADLDQNQIDTETGPAETVQTPLDAILDGAADVPAQEREAEAGIGGMDAPQVPLVALKKERERRKKSDRQIEELRAELQKFEDSKYGFDQESVDEMLAQQPASDDSPKDPLVQNYDRSLQRFRAVHGKEAEAKVDAATKRMNAEQRQHVLNLAGSHADPVAAIHGYAGQLGLLDFKGTPIEEVLASKDKPDASQDNSELARHYAELNRHGQEVAAAERRATVMASKTDFVSEYGKAAYNELDQVATAFVVNDPRGAEFRQIVESHPDPIGMAAHLLSGLGYWQQQGQQQPQRQPQPTFPSNLTTRRNVGQRAGPSYSGPTPLNSIFRN